MRQFSSILLVGSLTTLVACDPGQGVPDAGSGDVCETGQAVCEITQDITADTTWSADHVYELKANVFVDGAVLTIQPGTVIKGNLNSSLAIASTSRLVAEGTVAAPIVFTSTAAQGSRRAGDWGGLVLLGKAPINVQGGVDNIEGYPESALTQYGGGDAAHDCGTLRYVRVEFAGYRLGGNNELNGITLGGCGSATVVDYVQVHRGLDDGIEFFGGTANLKHAVITLSDDDGLDWDQGWTGKVQYLVTQQNRLLGNHGIEADNSSATPNATPRSAPTLYNVTLIGSDRAAGSAAQTQGGAILRVGTAGKLHNAVFAYFNDFAVDINGADSKAEADAGRLEIRDSLFFSKKVDYATAFPIGASGATDESAFLFGDAAKGNQVADPLLNAAIYVAGETPSFVPAAGSPALTGPAPVGDAFFDAGATFIGAVGPTDWTAGWTAFPES